MDQPIDQPTDQPSTTSGTEKTLRFDEVAAAGLADWRMLHSSLHARFRTGDFATGLQLVKWIGEAADELDHHPDLTLTYSAVDVRLTSHDVGGVSTRDLELARRITQYAADLDATPAPEAVQVLELALDTWDAAAIRPFWAAVLGIGTESDRPDEVTDGSGVLPSLWFQDTEEHGETPQRFHLDIQVPPEVARGRIEAAVAAGGTLVTAEHAPSFWVLADAQGNKACVCTGEGRE